MSLPGILQDNLESIIEELKIRATHQLMSNGHVNDWLLDVLDEFESHLPKVTVAPEEPVAVEAFVNDVSHEQFTHPDDVVETEEIK